MILVLQYDKGVHKSHVPKLDKKRRKAGGRPSQVEERAETEFGERLIVFTARTTHSFHHLLSQLHGWGHGLRVSTQYVTEIYVEQMSCKQKNKRLVWMLMLEIHVSLSP